jgi:mannose-6-phosphate isomerase-like protein (cupin superfamily)
VVQNVFRLKDSEFVHYRGAMRKATYTGQDLMLVYWIIEPSNPRTPLSRHPDNGQFGIILRGQIEMTVGDEKVYLGPGDIYWAPKDYPHGESVVVGDEPLHILDIFTPPRADYLAEAASAMVGAAGERGE